LNPLSSEMLALYLPCNCWLYIYCLFNLPFSLIYLSCGFPVTKLIDVHYVTECEVNGVN
jgi:hypothetical protein